MAWAFPQLVRGAPLDRTFFVRADPRQPVELPGRVTVKRDRLAVPFLNHPLAWGRDLFFVFHHDYFSAAVVQVLVFLENGHNWHLLPPRDS
jgi:hypothetical protein